MNPSSKYKPATKRQLAYMQERGIETHPRMTVSEASERITEYQSDPMNELDERHIHDIEDFQ